MVYEWPLNKFIDDFNNSVYFSLKGSQKVVKIFID